MPRRKSKGHGGGGARGGGGGGGGGQGCGGGGGQGRGGGGAGGGQGRGGGGGGGGGGGDGDQGDGGGGRMSRAKYIADLQKRSSWYEEEAVEDRTGVEDVKPAGPDRAQVLLQLHECAKGERFVARLRVWCKPPRQLRVSDLKDFHLSDLLPDALRKFYDESYTYFRETYPFLVIPGKLPNGEATTIPMTPGMEEDIENARHHIVNVGRIIDDAILQLSVVEFSGYCSGFRVLYGKDKDDPAKVPWCVFDDHTLPDCLPWHNIRYTSKYKFLASVKVEDGIGGRIFSFLETFRNKELDVNSQKFLDDKSHRRRTTTQGELLFDTLFVLIAEGRRFWHVAEWNLCYLGQIPCHFVHLIQDWLKTCRCVYYLYLYILDDALSMSTEETKSKVITKWTEANKDHSHLNLYNGEALDHDLLYKLSGGQLWLLRDAPDLFDCILLRKAGYEGPQMREIKKALVS